MNRKLIREELEGVDCGLNVRYCCADALNTAFERLNREVPDCFYLPAAKKKLIALEELKFSVADYVHYYYDYNCSCPSYSPVAYIGLCTRDYNSFYNTHKRLKRYSIDLDWQNNRDVESVPNEALIRQEWEDKHVACGFYLCEDNLDVKAEEAFLQHTVYPYDGVVTYLGKYHTYSSDVLQRLKETPEYKAFQDARAYAAWIYFVRAHFWAVPLQSALIEREQEKAEKEVIEKRLDVVMALLEGVNANSNA